MSDKKKFHGGLKVLLLLLFIMLLSTFSTCYALTSVSNINNEFLGCMIDTALNNVDYICTSTYATSIKTTLSNFKTNANFDSFTTDFISACNSLNVEYVEQLTFVMQQNSSVITITQNNNTIGDILPFICFVWQMQDGSTFIYNNRYINSSKSFTTGSHFTFTPSYNGTYTISGTYSQSSSNFNQAFRFQYRSLQNITIDPVNSVCFIPGVFGLGNQNIYLNLSNTNISEALPYWNTNKINCSFEPVPEPEPSGESSGEIIPGGTITNPSGEVTGKVDLTNIENGIENINQNLNTIENKIPSSGDIVSANIASNENYWGKSGDLNGEEQEQLIEDSFNQVFDSLSGDLYSNPVFGFLESGEDIFLNFFKNQQDESYYDLIISWNDVNLFGGNLVEQGSINISQLCRDVPELGNVQQLLRIIFNFGCLVALLWQIYNLVLSTLGIDNPYLYENAHVTDVVNPDTGEVRTYYRRTKRIFKRW